MGLDAVEKHVDAMGTIVLSFYLMASPLTGRVTCWRLSKYNTIQIQYNGSAIARAVNLGG